MIDRIRDKILNWLREMSPEQKRSILDYLEGIRRVLIVSIVAIIVGATVSFAFSDKLFDLVNAPIAAIHLKLYFKGVFEGFYIKMKLALFAGVVLAFPVIVYEIWRFIKPLVPPKERRRVIIIFPAAVLLFAGGCMFGYCIILPAALYFLVVVMGTGLHALVTVDDFLSKLVAFTLPFGLIFELPVVVYFLTRLGIVRAEQLSHARKYAILVIAIVAAVVTPGPDPVSQCLVGVPMWLLYEVSIVISRVCALKNVGIEPAPGQENEADS